MSYVFKCDRCGELYSRPYGSRRYIEITHDLHPYGTEILHLCDNCQKELIAFLGDYTIGKRNIDDLD